MGRGARLRGVACGIACCTGCGPTVIEGESVGSYPPGAWDVGRCGPMSGEQMLLADDQDGPRSIAVDETSVYWAQSNVGGDGLMKLPKDGGPLATLAPAVGAQGIVVDAEYVYWLDYDNVGGLYRLPKTGAGVAEQLATGARSTELAQDEGNLYFVNTGSLSSGYVDGSIMKLPKDGGPPIALASNQTQLDQLALGGRYVFWTHRTSGAASGSSVGELAKVDKSGGSETVVFEGENVAALTTDDEWVYWTAATDGGHYPNGIWRASIDGSEAELLVETDALIWEMVVDGPCLYYADEWTSVMRVDKDGGTPSRVAEIGSAPHIAVDETTVYVTASQEGVVWAIDK